MGKRKVSLNQATDILEALREQGYLKGDANEISEVLQEADLVTTKKTASSGKPEAYKKIRESFETWKAQDSIKLLFEELKKEKLDTVKKDPKSKKEYDYKMYSDFDLHFISKYFFNPDGSDGSGDKKSTDK